MARFLACISYDGTDYSGWQLQKQDVSTVQGTIEEALFTWLRNEISIVGCGRTDTGVHADGYYFHFDTDKDMEHALYKLNSILPETIAVHSMVEVNEDFHARFDATSRTYEYSLRTYKDPFLNRFSYRYYGDVEVDKLQSCMDMIASYEEFFPFCKTKTDVKTMRCNISQATWSDAGQGRYRLRITSDRFLRGMIRLIVGACLNVNRDKVSLEEVRHAMDNQRHLETSWSVPACGLILKDIVYSDLKIVI